MASNADGEAKNRDSQGISGYRSMTAAVRTTNATVDLLRISEFCLSQPAWTTTTKREVAIEDCARCFVLLKLTTNRHEASRGLSVTAELLVPLCARNRMHNSRPLIAA